MQLSSGPWKERKLLSMLSSNVLLLWNRSSFDNDVGQAFKPGHNLRNYTGLRLQRVLQRANFFLGNDPFLIDISAKKVWLQRAHCN